MFVRYWFFSTSSNLTQESFRSPVTSLHPYLKKRNLFISRYRGLYNLFRILETLVRAKRLIPPCLQHLSALMKARRNTAHAWLSHNTQRDRPALIYNCNDCSGGKPGKEIFQFDDCSGSVFLDFFVTFCIKTKSKMRAY